MNTCFIRKSQTGRKVIVLGLWGRTLEVICHAAVKRLMLFLFHLSQDSELIFFKNSEQPSEIMLANGA